MVKSGVSLKWGGLDKAMHRAVQRLANKDDLLAQVGEALVSGTLQRFEDERAPDGSPWDATRRGGKILADSGRLKRSIEYRNTEDAVFVGSNLIYARIHQLGGVINPKNKKKLRFKSGDSWVSTDEVTIPARPYLGISEDDQEEVRETINDFLKDAFTGH